MTFLPPTGDGAATRSAVPSQGPGSSEPGLTATVAADATPTIVPFSWEPDASPSRLGLVALVVALVLVVLSSIASVATGTMIGPFLPDDGSADGSAVAENIEAAGAGSLVITALAHVGIGAVLGLWALVQGIVAVATRRGRGYGVAAIVIAIVAPIVSYAVFTVAASFTAASIS
jgi:hypothetical protein